MNKKGFTLGEILITLAIVAIVSALTLPMVNKIKPDKNKVMFYKTYDEIAATIKDLRNSKFFAPCFDYNSTIKVCSEDYRFYNISEYKSYGVTKYSRGRSKFCNALKDAISVGADIKGCSGGYKDPINPEYNFTSANGAIFSVQTHFEAPANVNGVPSLKEYLSYIAFDVDGADNGGNCYYNADTCKSPDRFVIWMMADGSLFPGDAASKAYLAERGSHDLTKGDGINNQVNTLRRGEFKQTDNYKKNLETMQEACKLGKVKIEGIAVPANQSQAANEAVNVGQAQQQNNAQIQNTALNSSLSTN